MSGITQYEKLQNAVNWLAVSGSQNAAARDSGIPRSSLQRYIKLAHEAGITSNGHDPRTDRLTEHQIAQSTEMGIPSAQLSHGWEKTESGSYFFKVPKVGEDTDRILNAVIEGLAGAPRARKVKAPETTLSRLAAVFPIADLHMGLLTDEEEVGTDWDSRIAIDTFEETFTRIVQTTPAAEVAVIAQLGDLTHTDDQTNATPQSKHQLDVDSRYFMILRRAVAAMKFAIDSCLLKFGRVVYRGCRGNHDLHAHYAVTLALKEHYANETRVVIEDSASEFYVFEFGQNMLLLCHGDKTKAERLVMFAASEFPDTWGRTRHRKALTGHVHHESVKEFSGMTVETIGTIIPRDSYAYSHAYGASRSLVSIVLDEDEGEISRNRVGV